MKIRNIALVAALMLMGNAMASSKAVHKVTPIAQGPQGSKYLMTLAAVCIAGLVFKEYAKPSYTPNIMQRVISHFNKKPWQTNCCELALIGATGLAIFCTKRPLTDKVSLAAMLGAMLLS